MITIALGARGALLSLRCTLQRAGSFARLGLIQNTRSGFVRRGQILTRIPKITLLYWGAVNGSLSAVRCQEVLVQPQASEKKSLAKIQVHRLIFFLRLSFRALVLLFKFVPLLLLYPLVLVFTRWMPHWLDALLWVTETSGPTFIKLGQWASTRRDIFSQDFCNRFSRLHVKVRPHSWAHTKQCLRRAFGEGWRRVLVFRSKEPVGSGCIAQVYRGWARVDQVEDPAFQSIVEEMEKDDLLEAWEIPGLGGMARSLRQLWRGSGEEESSEDKSLLDGQQEERLIPVAIKVVHPGVRRQVEIDLLLMKAGSWLLHCLPGLKWLSICEIVEEFEKLMTKQESEPISNYLSSEVPKEVKQRIAKMGVDTLLKMVFLDNFVHGDLHPGNILVQCQGPLAGSGDGTGISGEHHGKTTLTDLLDTVVVSVRPPPCPIQLVLLDAGIVAQLSDRDLANFKAVFTAVVLRQGERVAELILNHARANECKDAALFKKEMAELVDHALSSNTLSLGKVQVADLLSRVFGLLIKHKVKLESNFSSIIFAIMVLEGLGRSLDPNLDILDLAKPLLLKNCASLL
ncbi:putative aarF domain-containing protein kinase 2 isoform X2 [Maylandia zebra]|uniref:putative aarF domain-containing protein kinase 2 isoform X2 n=1 Tax=Maylandia zebra TaxID=106582 RepID=UPI00403C8C8C